MIPNDKSNLGWRILAELFLDEDEQRKVIKGSLSGKPIVELLSSQFVERQMRAIKLARAVRSQDATGEAVQDELRELVGENFANHVLQSLAQAEPPVAALDKKLPTILFTSFKGWIDRFKASLFVEWLPKDLVDDRGQLRAKDLK